ncbi:UNVERIFIED_CONTAM: hypothetical protein RMT77_014190 [Armadillidium vulgare]
MASSISLFEEDLSCPICFEEYNLVENDRMPKLLLCLHTVCFTCLENLLSDDESVKCPICRTEHQINEDLEDLLDNDAVITHIRSKQEELDKKAAIDVYWKEWLEKCSYEIPDDELRANVQDLVRNSLTPFDGAKHPSMPEQQDLQKRLQEKQEQQQQQERYRRHIRHHNQEQRQAQQEGGFNWTELFEMLSQFLIQLNEQFNNPSHSNQNRQEAGEGSRQRRQETGEGRQHHRQEGEEEPHQYSQVDGLQQMFEEVEVEEEEEDDDYEEEEDEDENHYLYCDDDNEWEDIYDDYDYDDDNDEEEVEVVEIEAAAQAPQHQHQQTQHHHQQSQSNQSASKRTITVGRKIFVTGATVNKFADLGFIRNGFEDICGTVDGITLYCGTDICPCSYAILELRNNIYFVDGEYRFGGQTFKAKLCSGFSGKVFVARLPVRIENNEVRAHFGKFGNICHYHRPVHHITSNPVTYCFITFSEEETVEEVLKYENHYINGEKFVVRPHIERS